MNADEVDRQLNIPAISSVEAANESNENIGERFLWEFVQEQEKLKEQEWGTAWYF